MSTTTPARDHTTLLSLACFFLLCVGIGRLFALVTHTPVLGYANNYEMIPLQACRQIWPAGNGVDITRGTPAAPLAQYTLDKHVDTPCLPSSDLLFTRLGIALGESGLGFSNNQQIAIRDIGLTRALLLTITAFLAQFYFFRQRKLLAQAIHSVAILLILSDPALTLYYNTFYSDFALEYFFYLSVLGVCLLLFAQWQIRHAWLLLIGLIGLGFSKPLLLSFLTWFGVLLVLWILLQRQFVLAGLVALACVIPPVTQTAGYFTPTNANMELASKINLVGSSLGTGAAAKDLLFNLDLPDTCQQLSGKNWYAPVVQQQKICFELSDYSRSELALSVLSYPSLASNLFMKGLPQLKEWIIRPYGQVEGERQGSVYQYFGSSGTWIKNFSDNTLAALFVAPIFIVIILFILAKLLNHSLIVALRSLGGLALLSFLPLALYCQALFTNGLVDLLRNTLLVLPTLLLVYLVLAAMVLSWLAQKVFSQSRETPGK